MSSTLSNLPPSYDNKGEVDPSFNAVTQVKRENLVPIFDPKCSHKNLKITASLELPDFDDYHCDDCHRGWLVKKAK